MHFEYTLVYLDATWSYAERLNEINKFAADGWRFISLWGDNGALMERAKIKVNIPHGNEESSKPEQA